MQGAGERLDTCSSHGDVAFRATASLWSRIAHARRDQAFGLESLECGVQSTRRDVASCTIRQFRTDGHAIGAIAESEDRKEDQLFEFAQIHPRCHLNCIVVEMRELSSCTPLQSSISEITLPCKLLIGRGLMAGRLSANEENEFRESLHSMADPLDAQAAAFAQLLGGAANDAGTAFKQACALADGLFPHQVEGVAFLLGRRRAILADDMGLGKTRQASVSLQHLAPNGPYFVVCPASVKRNWAREIERLEPRALI
jgi:hypothetical protein